MDEEAAAPLDGAAFERLFAPVLARKPAGLVIAVSGGPDSIALMQLTARLAAQGGLPPVAVATVDHGLRAGSADEAAFVLEAAAAAGFPGHALRWTGPRPVAAIQERARAARYGLLVDLCLRLGADHLLTAHTRDDQAETVLFRLARGSGPAGLAGMRPFTPVARGVVQARPLLPVHKARLVATCAAGGWRTVRDPSNDDPRYARTRLRRLLPALAAEGLDANAFGRLAARMDRTEEALDHATAALTGDVLRTLADGSVEIDLARLARLPLAFTVRLLGRALADRRPERPVRLDRLEQAADACREAARCGVGMTRTLHGCLLRVSPEGRLSIGLETSRRRGIAPPAAHAPVKSDWAASLGNESRCPYIGR